MNILWNFYFWLGSVALMLTLVEVTKKKLPRSPTRYTTQDFFWFLFNVLAFGYIFNWVFTAIAPAVFYSASSTLANTFSFASIAAFPLWLQFIVLLLVQDFIEWNVHYALHRVPFLWEIHKLHHSIENMNWFGNFRFHWLEIVVYKTVKYVPLLVIAPTYQVAFFVGIFGVLIGSLNHLSIPYSWRPHVLGYIFNSPGFHLWHHNAAKETVNYAIIFTFWDYLFGTAYNATDKRPARIGLLNSDFYPQDILRRLFYPLTKTSKTQENKI